jgi:glucose-1-phosphate cytidylyltransferase
MKVVIFAGGFGSRISEESLVKPKPMIEIGGMPILWHIMKIYSSHGLNDFVICCGYKGYMIKDFFANYHRYRADLTYDLERNQAIVHRSESEPWRVTCVETGETTMTGGRLKRAAAYIGDEEFCLTYGDGVADIDITESIKFHKLHGKLATLTAVQSPGRFGAFSLQSGSSHIGAFAEKPKGDGAWINGGFFVLDPGVLKYIEGDDTSWEREPLEMLAKGGELMAFRHEGFWQSMDTLRDKFYLEDLIAKGTEPWNVWRQCGGHCDS